MLELFGSVFQVLSSISASFTTLMTRDPGVNVVYNIKRQLMICFLLNLCSGSLTRALRYIRVCDRIRSVLQSVEEMAGQSLVGWRFPRGTLSRVVLLSLSDASSRLKRIYMALTCIRNSIWVVLEARLLGSCSCSD
jgi:hypothetical protein